jgi:hypothetical protein
MKRNYLFKNTGGVMLLSALLAVTLLSSCLKDKSPGAINFADSPPLVGFQYSGFAETPITTKIHGQSTDTTGVEITLSVASLTLKTPVTVTVSVDNADAQAYAQTDTVGGKPADVVLSSSLYTIANGGKVTINPGQQIVKLKISFAGDKINFNQYNILGLKITAVAPSSVVIATNLNFALLALTLQSVYEGEYTNTGSFTDVTNANLTDAGIYPEDIDLLTASAYVVDFYDLSFGVGYGHPISSSGTISYYGGFVPEFDFDPSLNGKIDAMVNGYGQGNNNRSGKLDATGVNAATGTPGTKGFKIQVKYIMHQTNTGVDRTFFNETYTYVGPAK